MIRGAVGAGRSVMMGGTISQPTLYYNISLEDFVPQDHPLRSIRPLIDTKEIRKICRDLYAPIGRPSIPPEQLFLALVAGYLLGIASERKLVMELQCNMAVRWFEGWVWKNMPVTPLLSARTAGADLISPACWKSYSTRR
jgi:hypothetical protein